jgi:uncharacterized repeat protein (TIGR01451 family)
VIVNATGSVTATNWTVSGNTSTAGAGSSGPAEAGGIDVTGGTMRLNHATVADNSAGGNADDLHTTGSGSVTVLNSIIDGSSANDAVPCAADGGAITSGGHNIDRGSSCGFTAAGDMSNTDPRLAVLSETFPVSTRALTYGSPAVDAADAPNCPLTDAIGTKRPQGAGCDIGAIESFLTNLAVAGTAAPTSVPSGGQVTFTFVISNLSGTVPQGVQFTDVLPLGAALVSAASTSGTCASGTQIVCTLPGVHRGGDATVTIIAKLVRGGANVDQAHVQSELPDSDMTNDNSSVTVSVAGGHTGSGPTLSHLRVVPRAFRVGTERGQGTTISFADSVSGRVTFTVLRLARGIRIKGLCVARHHRRPNKRHPACMRSVTVGIFVHAAKAGRTSFGFSGRVAGHVLGPGQYELRATQSNSAAVTAKFSIERPATRRR